MSRRVHACDERVYMASDQDMQVCLGEQTATTTETALAIDMIL